jgi:hypothetical protein
MMNAHLELFHGGTFQMAGERRARIDAAVGELQRVDSGQALQFGHLGGDLTVVDGRVWLTRDGDPGDHVIEPGQRVRLGLAERAVIEPAVTGTTVTVHWIPRRQAFLGALLAEPLRRLALAAGWLAAGFAALARSAAASASRAQGCISGADSMACSGALK